MREKRKQGRRLRCVCGKRRTNRIFKRRKLRQRYDEATGLFREESREIALCSECNLCVTQTNLDCARRSLHLAERNFSGSACCGKTLSLDYCATFKTDKNHTYYFIPDVLAEIRLQSQAWTVLMAVRSFSRDNIYIPRYVADKILEFLPDPGSELLKKIQLAKNNKTKHWKT